MLNATFWAIFKHCETFFYWYQRTLKEFPPLLHFAKKCTVWKIQFCTVGNCTLLLWLFTDSNQKINFQKDFHGSAISSTNRIIHFKMSALNSELLKAKKRATKIWFLSCDGYDIPFANYLTSFIIDHNFVMNWISYCTLF